MGGYIAAFMAGSALGCAMYRWIVILTCENIHPTMCDICKFRHEKTARRRRKDQPFFGGGGGGGA